jgi:ABC-type multidrug transport system fused ATPase/permease subunit
VGDVNTATFPERLWDAVQRAWRSVLLNMTLLVLSVLASAATVIILGFLINLFIQGYSSGSDPAGLGGLAVFLALVGYYIVGIPALLICTLLWLAYRASSAARARALARLRDQPAQPL